MLNDKNQSILQQEPEKFNKPNVLINISKSNDLTAKDKKVYNLIIRKLLSCNLQGFNSNEIRTSISEISRDLGILNRNDLYKILNILSDTTIHFIEFDDIDNQEVITRSKMISSYSKPVETKLFDSDDNIDTTTRENLTIRFDTHLTRKLLKYSENYAKLDLNDLNNLKNTYAVTLYENFLKSITKYSYGKKNLSESELRLLLHLEDKYLTIKSFNQLVIKKATDEINKKTKLTINYKRVKVNNENIYKFEISQDYRYNFKKFKKTIVDNFYHLIFDYKKSRYCFSKDLDQKHSKMLMVNADTFKTQTTEKATEIFQFMYEILNRDSLEFTSNLLVNKDLNITDYKIPNDEIDLEILTSEAKHFQELYEES